jgi:SAM-dependent methyltransferase
MPKTAPFDEYPDRYDAWYDEHRAACRSELDALRALLPESGEGLDIGVGTGRLAALLGLDFGVDPSPEMRRRAHRRGITVRDGVAEALPYREDRFDEALMTTTLCYLDDPPRAFREAHRVLRPGGTLVVGFIDRDHPLGQRYARSDSPFYENVSFHTVPEVLDLLDTAGFESLTTRQTLFTDAPGALDRPDPVTEGYGNGGFVAVRGRTPE